MKDSANDLTEYLLERVRLVQRNLGLGADAAAGADSSFSDLLDSMAMVEFLGILSEDCGVDPAAIEECVGRRFGTVQELAAAMRQAGIMPRRREATAGPRLLRTAAPNEEQSTRAYLAATAIRLPTTLQSAGAIDAALGRPDGWFETHTGIRSRRLWAGEDPLRAAATAGRECLEAAGVTPEKVSALLVTSEAPPLLAGFAAALHHQLDLPEETVALEIGGACTGFLTSMWTAQKLLTSAGAVLVIAVESPSHYLTVEPGPAGETAALFGDGAAASLLCPQPAGPHSLLLREVVLAVDGSAGALLRPTLHPKHGVSIQMDGTALALRAIDTMAEAVKTLLQRHRLSMTDLSAVVAHGGNGRMPALLARRLGLTADRVWSTTAVTGNLGSASVPAAWAMHGPTAGPVIWVAVGAGLTWGAALLECSKL
jgi:3-oxoacyl-[acyl-carrier-protein] synthase-3